MPTPLIDPPLTLLERLDELERLRDVSQVIAQTRLDPSALAAVIAAEASKIIDTHSFQVGIYDKSAYRILFWRFDGAIRQTPQTFDLSKRKGLTAWVRDNRQMLHVNDFEKELATLPARPSYINDRPPRSALFIPMLSGETAVGLIMAQSAQPNHFSEGDVKRLSIVANIAASALVNAQLYYEAQQQSADLKIVSSIARQVNDLKNPDDIFEQVVTFARKQLGFHPVTIMAIDSESGDAINRYSSLETLTGDTFTLQPEDGLTGLAMSSRKTVLVNDVMQDDRYVPGVGREGFDEIADRTKAEIVIPLLAKQDLIGVMDVQSDKIGGFSPREVNVLEALAQEVATAIEQAHELEDQREQAWIATVQAEIAQSLNSLNSIDAIITSVTRLTKMLTDVSCCGVLLWDEEADCYRPKMLYGVDSAEVGRFLRHDFALGSWPILDAVHSSHKSHRASYITPWSKQTIRFVNWQLLPIHTPQGPLGVLLISHAGSRRLRPKQRHLQNDLLQSIARQIAPVLNSVMLRSAQENEAWNNTALLKVAQAMNNLNDFHQILETIVRLVPMLIGVRSCFILLSDDNGDTLKGGPSYGLTQQGQKLLAQFDESELDELLTLDELLVDQRTNLSIYRTQLPDWIAQETETDSVSVVPLRARNSLVGLLVVGQTIDGKPLEGSRIGLLAGIAQQAALAVINNQLNKEAAIAATLAREVDVALAIQTSLIPDGSPPIPGFEVASSWEAAHQVSGDFYDFLQFPNGKWGIVIADVAGKGVPAALFMALCRTIIRSVGFRRDNSAETLIRTNEIILDDTQTDLFVTVLYAMWDPRENYYSYTNAGHNPPLVIRSNGDVEVIGQYGIALGVIDTVPLIEQTVNIASGDTIILYTDGVTEAMNANAEPLGMTRLKAALTNTRTGSASEVVQLIKRTIRQHTGVGALSDDVTMVVMRHK